MLFTLILLRIFNELCSLEDIYHLFKNSLHRSVLNGFNSACMILCMLKELEFKVLNDNVFHLSFMLLYTHCRI